MNSDLFLSLNVIINQVKLKKNELGLFHMLSTVILVGYGNIGVDIGVGYGSASLCLDL